MSHYLYKEDALPNKKHTNSIYCHLQRLRSVLAQVPLASKKSLCIFRQWCWCYTAATVAATICSWDTETDFFYTSYKRWLHSQTVKPFSDNGKLQMQFCKSVHKKHRNYIITGIIGTLSNPTIHLSVHPTPLVNNGEFSATVLQNTNRKPRAGSQTHWHMPNIRNMAVKFCFFFCYQLTQVILHERPIISGLLLLCHVCYVSYLQGCPEYNK